MSKKKKYTYGPLPRSREEALSNPIRIVACAVKETKYNLKMGYLEPFRWILNRPMSLQFDFGIDVMSPTSSGELICTIE